MSKEQVTLSELLPSLDSSELQEAELVRAALVQQLSSDRGGAVLSSLVDHYLDSASSQAVLLLASIREPHHKPLLEKLNECVNRAGSRLAALTLLGHLVQKQPPWIHHISRSPLLPALLRCLKTDSDVVVLITAVLLLVTLLPMIPQAGKQHIYDFFDVFGRLVSWSYRNPGQVPAVHLVHLHAGVYSLFHRLYGMFPCNFISYLRLHYSMKENLDTFQEVVKPMLEHVRVHPELVTGTQDYELDPSRWKCFEVHDIVIECSRVCLDPLESSCEDDAFTCATEPPPSPSPSLRPAPLSWPLPRLTFSPIGSSASLPDVTFDPCAQDDDVTWSPSSHCGLSTPPPEPAGPAPPLARTASLSVTSQARQQPITEKDGTASDVIHSEDSAPRDPAPRDPAPRDPAPLTSTPGCDQSNSPLPRSLPPCFTPPVKMEEGGPAPPGSDGPAPPGSDSPAPPGWDGPAPPYESLFALALPRAAVLFLGRKTQEALQQQEGGGGAEEGGGAEPSLSPPPSPLEVLDQLIAHGRDTHQWLSRRCAPPPERAQSGGKQSSMKTKGVEEQVCVQAQVQLLHSALMYERFKRQQHNVRNRRLLRRLTHTAALEEQCVATRAQLGVQDSEIRCLKLSLEEEQRRYTHLQQDTHTHTAQLHTHVQQLMLQLQDEQTHNQRLQSELHECQKQLRDVGAELQRANNKASHCEHLLSQLSLKLSSSEQQQDQIFLLNQQLLVLRETNRALTNQLEGGVAERWTEASMLRSSEGKEVQRLRDVDLQHKQKLESANQRLADLEGQLTRKDQLILDLKKLLDQTKTQSRAELSACDSRCVALRRVTQKLQTEMLHLYSLTHLDALRSGGAQPADGPRPRPPSSSSVGIVNGGVPPSPSPPLSLSLSLSPMESPLAVGSYLEQRARQLFGSANRSAEEEGEGLGEEEGEGLDEEEGALDLEAEEATPLSSSPLLEPLSPTGPAPSVGPAPSAGPAPSVGPAPPSADLTLAVRQRRRELSIMDYDETLPDY